jgi:hypothetical protein
MYALIGIIHAHYPEETDSEEIVALFTTEKKARDYEKKSRLSTYSEWCRRGCKQYRQKSLLSRFCKAEVEGYESPSYTVDPTL